MNLVLYDESECSSSNEVSLSYERAQQLLEIKQLEPGSEIRIGRVGGDIVAATVMHIGKDGVRLRLDPRRVYPAPEILPLTLLCALPRPQSLKKILQTISELGVSRVLLCGSKRVQKSYFQSKILEPSAIQHFLHLGMQQVVSTHQPEVVVYTRLREALAECQSIPHRIVATPEASVEIQNCDVASIGGATVLAIGPEGGWAPEEVELFLKERFVAVRSGRRMLRCDTAVSVLVAQYALLRRLHGC